MLELWKKFSDKTFASLAIRNYRIYAFGQFVSQCGTWMQTVVLGWLVIELTGSGTQLGVVVALQFLPMLVLGPWGGVMVDRFNKLTILYFTHGIFALLALAMSILVYTGLVELWMLYVFSFALGLIRIFDNPARQTMAPELVKSHHLKNAVSLNATANNLARAVGPAVGGVLIAVIGIAACFFFNALSYLFAIVTLALLHKHELHTAPSSGHKKGQLQEGFRYALKTPNIRRTLIMMALIGTFSYEFQVSLPLLADIVFRGNAESYAALLGAMGLGSVIGGLYAASQHEVAAKDLVFFALLFGISMLATAAMPNLFLATLGMGLVGFFSINFTALATTVLQLESEPQMRGRIMSLWSVAFIGSTTIGGPIIGFIGEFAGARWGLGFGGLIAVFTAALVGVRMLRRRQRQRVSESIEVQSETSMIGTGKL